MKYLLLILVCSVITVFAYAEDEVVNPNDPNMAFYKSEYTAASVVDNTGTFEAVQTEYHKIAKDKDCPACNLQGGIDLVDESGTAVVAGDGSKVKTGTGTGSGTLGQ